MRYEQDNDIQIFADAEINHTRGVLCDTLIASKKRASQKGRLFFYTEREVRAVTERDKRFADEYFVDYSPKNAAIRAGYSEKTARNAANWIKAQNPEKPRLKTLIDQKAAELSRRTGVTAERVIGEIAKIAFANISDIVDPETGKMLDDVKRPDASAVAGIRVKCGEDWEEYEVKMHDKIKALDQLGKYLGLFKENIQIEGAVPVIMDDIGRKTDDE